MSYYQDLVGFASHASNLAVPGLGTAISVGIEIYNVVDQVQVYRRQCRYLADRCATLLLALRDSIEGLEGTTMAALTDEVSATVSRILTRVTAWGNLGFLQSIVQNSQINEGVENFHRNIDSCMARFHIYMGMELCRGQRDIRLMQEQMADEFRSHLETVVTEMYTTLFARPPETVESIMSSLQMQLSNPDLEADQQVIFQDALQRLHRDRSNLSLLPNLQNGETSDVPVIHNVHENQRVTDPRESTATTGGRPILAPLTLPQGRLSTVDSNSSGSSPSRLSSVFSSQPRSENGSDYSPASPISLNPMGQTEGPDCQVDGVTRRIVPSSHQLHLSGSSTTPQYLPPIDLNTHPLGDIRQTWTSTTGGDWSRPAPSPIVELPDFTLLVREDDSGKVTAGTVEGLIERLISDSPDFRRKMAYRGTFFISYVGFTTADTVFKFLAQRLLESGNSEGHRRGTILYNVIAVMKDWLASPHVQVEMDVLQQMKNFALSFGPMPRMVEFANYVTEKINMRNVIPDHPPYLLSRTTVPTLHPPSQETNSGSLAKALTILEGRIYDRLLPGDYIVHFMHPSTEGNIANACKIHKAINNWVKKSILIRKDYEERAEEFEFFVNTAIECHKICNFASMEAIIDALQSPSIMNLCATISTVKKRPHPQQGTKKGFSGLKSLFSPSHSLLKALSDLKESISTRYGKALEKSNGDCVPWIGTHLAQLKTVFDKYPQTIKHEEHTLINFKRYCEFSLEMGKLTECMAPILVHDPKTRSSLVYLEDQLSAVQEDNGIENHIVRRSQKLEVEEKRLEQLRTPQLRAAGFRV